MSTIDDNNNIQDNISIERRLSALEERTKPKPKSRLEKIKDWGGLIALLITIAYSFPLGIWNEFFVSVEEKNKKEIEELRSVVEKSNEMVADGARYLSGISDPELIDMIQRSLNTRLYIVMSKNRDGFLQRIEEFTAPESVVIGYNFFLTGQVPSALTFFEDAGTKAAANSDPVTELESIRLRAKALFTPGPSQDVIKARELYSLAAARFDQERNQQFIPAHIFLLAEWGLYELFDGDWTCGQAKIAESQKMYSQFESYMNDQGNFRRLIANRIGSLRPKNNQARNGC